MRIQINALFIVAAGLACSLIAHCSVLVPTYVLPPPSFNTGQRTLARLAGGHLRLPSLRDAQSQQHNPKDSPDHGKNSLTPPGEKDVKYSSQRFKENDAKDSESKNYDKYAGAVIKTEGQNVGWNQGQWDDGMLMSSAGEGEEKGKKKTAETDEDKKTLSDQVAEGKYGLIQKEIFINPPTQPGVISYTANPETKNKDNERSLGGLKKEEIWLAEDHLLVLKGGSFPDHGAKPTAAGDAWPAIDAFVAPPRQVKIPQNPEVPPPFPVRLSDGGPLVFLTPEGSIPAPAFPPLPGFGASASPPFSGPYPPSFPPEAFGADQGNFTAGRAPFPFPPFPFAPRNGSEFPFPFPAAMNNGSFPGGPQGPGAPFAPPPGNLTDLYDEDDPSIYYPPPYSFYYRADNTSKVPAGPLVPGIVLPPPPDFFAPLEPYTTKAPPTTTTTTTTTTTQAPAHAYPATPVAPPTAVLKPRPPQRRPAKPTAGYLPVGKPSYVLHDNTIDNISSPPPKTVTITSRPAHRQPDRVVVIPKPNPPRKIYSNTPVAVEKNPPSITVIHKPIKTTLKPVPISGLYDFPSKNFFEGNSVTQSPRPFPVYGPPERTRVKQFPDKTYVTSTPVPLRAYYSEPTYEENPQPQIQYANQPDVRIRPDYFNARQNGKSVASFYFYEEPSKSVVATPSPVAYFDGQNYYQSVGANGQEGYFYNSQPQGGFAPSSNLEYAPAPSRDPSPFFFVPQRQGSRTLTQEYFSVQKPKVQTYTRPNSVQQQAPVSSQQQSNRPSSFYDQIANIQQTIDYYTTRRPVVNAYRPSPYREVRQKAKPTPRPVYQFSYQSESARPEQNTFRAPQMDSEPFRPMVSYSKPFNGEGEKYRATPSPVLKTTTESSYATLRPEEFNDYQDIPVKSDSPAIKTRQRGLNPTTRNPVNHAYYTKQEEGLFDDITKNYFTIFGQKIEQSNSDGIGVAVTAPITPVEVSTVKTPLDNGINIRYEENSGAYSPERQAVGSLAGDTAVNYRQPRPLINPDSEFIPIVNPEVQAKYEADRQFKQIRDQLSHRQRVKNVEIIKSEGVEQADQFEDERLQYYQAQQNSQRGQSNGGRGQVAEGRPGSLVAYRLPGEGAHVYFLTPQPARPDGLKYRTAEEIAALS